MEGIVGFIYGFVFTVSAIIAIAQEQAWYLLISFGIGMLGIITVYLGWVS
jgi:hypothetical protein